MRSRRQRPSRKETADPSWRKSTGYRSWSRDPSSSTARVPPALRRPDPVASRSALSVPAYHRAHADSRPIYHLAAPSRPRGRVLANIDGRQSQLDDQFDRAQSGFPGSRALFLCLADAARGARLLARRDDTARDVAACDPIYWHEIHARCHGSRPDPDTEATPGEDAVALPLDRSSVIISISRSPHRDRRFPSISSMRITAKCQWRKFFASSRW